MSITLEAEAVPLARDEHGVIRVGSTRVTLDTVIAAYRQDETPETIADQYPALSLADVYAAITFYLRHREDVDAYLAEQQHLAEEVRKKHESRFSQDGLCEELLARRDASHRS